MGESENLQEYVRMMTVHQGNLRAFIVSLMPGSPDVDDVLQETNAVLWLKRERFEMGTNFLAWGFTIARYEVMRQRDRTKRLERVFFSDALLERLVETDTPEEPESRMAALERCLAKLSEAQRKIVKERYTPGRSVESYANHSGHSAGGMRMALLRIRESLKDCVEKTLAGESV